LIAFLAVQVCVNPRTFDALILLGGRVRRFPISLRIPPESSEGMCQCGWWFGSREGLLEFVEGHSENTHCQFPYCELLNENFATLETTVIEPARKERAKSEAVELGSTMLTVQVLWACHAFNARPEEAAKRVVTDLFEQLSRGGSVSVHVTSSDGTECTLDVAAESR
jgi:hypothetical protein